MKNSWETIYSSVNQDLSNIPDESRDVIVLSTFSNIDNYHKDNIAPANYQLSDHTIKLLDHCSRILRLGGLLFIYGNPHQLPFIGQYLYWLKDSNIEIIFKYWISLAIDNSPRNQTLKPISQGLLIFVKHNSQLKTPPKLLLNTDQARIPHVYCSACTLNVKDWGGKKHLMNPKGVAISDVWLDLPKLNIKDHITPDIILDRILLLTNYDNFSHLHIIQEQSTIEINSNIDANNSIDHNSSDEINHHQWQHLTSLEINKVYQGDCISFLERVNQLYPQGIFDLAFADPPYNLKKSYDKYQDQLAEREYLAWCDRWLLAMVNSLKPGGSLFILNLPKWAMHHAALLNSKLIFRHWITWDALSDPRGKLMPAHYALLYYTKPGAEITFNYASLDHPSIDRADARSIDGQVLPPDSPQYCLRPSCIKKRKRINDDKKIELSDIWSDIHRIRHKRDRDDHPCQLPEKLLERIILLTTNKDGLVFDPFCGAGTTAIAATKLERNFVVTDLDNNYVEITNEKLAEMRNNFKLFGNYQIARTTVNKPKSIASKREIEIYLQQLTQRLGKIPTETDIAEDNAEILNKIDLIYANRGAALKRCKVALVGER